jgi:hypothetical protein
MNVWIKNEEGNTPINEMDSVCGEVIGMVAPYGDMNNASVEFVHFDGSDWYDRGSRTCTVLYWIPLNYEYLKK